MVEKRGAGLQMLRPARGQTWRCLALPRGKRQRSPCSARREAQADLTLKPPLRAGCTEATGADVAEGVATGLAPGLATATGAGCAAALALVRNSASDGALALVAAAGFTSERWQVLQDTSSVTAVLTRV